ncbi:UDP-N-acetylmuramate dehydrogenase [Chromobacterium sphagni]|uniref:UDP-N-acetylenolpyruvoylglucosamine reductase n=1 Tax=Chromobacterium sphagni TaxID=1903179 RepID=A0A1S1X4K3_9NEIS|nr:UDP-N-acetylmuramate dehydrogenase [Chromobacterium sphagni]OHX14403.1 UDP-N-acetylenolpyruvoylglucosamine reductase [Chromobacterium sphagni]OHX19410.1 UDP-N-acetylenolpyruvoylglucosamine reductase [Chromobacterium sphagni]
MSLQFCADHDLRPLNTFGMAARAAHFCRLDNLADLPDLLTHPLYLQGPVLWLGGGSNLLLTRDYPGLVAKVGLAGIRLLEEDGDDVVVEAAAGENWHDFVLHALEQGWYGLENLSLIPGTVGACPVQNIGAYGVEVKDHLQEVVCARLDHGGEALVLSNADCRFGYRDSVFKHEAAGKLLVTAVRFRLSRRASLRTGYGDIQQQLERQGVSEPTPQDVSRAVIAIRRSKLPDPAALGNAGSFFKNPVVSRARAEALLAAHPKLPHYPTADGQVKLAAGWLIDQCGLKGYRNGDAGVHQKQALVLVNYGQARGEEIHALARQVQDAVAQRFGVRLEPEPLIL